MTVRLSLEGLEELREALRTLPDDLAAEASGIVTATAQDAQSEIQGGYPQGPTGNLRSHVTVTNNAANRSGATSIVKSSAPHAWIFENGTKVRHTAKGWNRGKMPTPPDAERMIPKVIRLRARMVGQLIDLVRRAGFEVYA